MSEQAPEKASEKILGIHHVTAVASHPQRNHDFYTGVLGQRLVKTTVNFDDPGTYHFYFGDELGRPGTIMTFFPWPDAPRGIRGAGQVTSTSWAAPAGSLGTWAERLGSFGYEVAERRERLGEEVLVFFDPDGLGLELIEAPEASERPAWEGGPVEAESSLRGFAGVTLTVRDLDRTAQLLEGMGMVHGGETGGRHRFLVGEGADRARIDVVASPSASHGRVAAGTVHHVAFRVSGDEAQRFWQDRLSELGLHVTEVRDRQYFRSVYFREPGGVLFELATDPPGFTRDETPAELGTGLKLPPWLEGERRRIEEVLPELERRPLAA